MYRDFQNRMAGKGPLDGYRDAMKTIHDPSDIHLLKTMYQFNKSCLKTNFYKEDVGAVGFRLDPRVFLADSKVPEIPFAIFMILGHDFNGFHVRFRDIARGGIRMILSTKDNYDNNRDT